MSEAVLEVRGLSARYGSVEALHPVDLTLGRGELVAVLGPNGAGKSTLLRAIMGLTPGGGQVRFEGTDLPRNDARAVTLRGVILVPEGRGVFGPMTVWHYIENWSFQPESLWTVALNTVPLLDNMYICSSHITSTKQLCVTIL